MTFTTLLSTDISLPEETWFPAQVRRHGRNLEVSASDQPSAHTNSRLQAMQTWLQRCVGQPASSFTDTDLEDLRWQGLKEKYDL